MHEAAVEPRHRRREHVKQALKRLIKPGRFRKSSSLACEEVPLKHGGISNASTALPTPDNSWGEKSNDSEAASCVRATRQTLDESWEAELQANDAQKLESAQGIGKSVTDESTADAMIPRTSSECSLYWTNMQSMLDANREMDRGSANTSFTVESVGRPRTPTVYNEYGAGCFQPEMATVPVVDAERTAALERRNTELEDRIAELERKLQEVAAQRRE